MSGVGALVTSIVSILLSEACSNSNVRPAFADCELATRSPSIVTELRAPSIPRICTERTSAPT